MTYATHQLLKPVAQLLLIPALMLGMLSYAQSTSEYTVEGNTIKHFHKGQSWMTVQQYDAAIKEFQIALRLKPATPMSASIYNNLGLAFLATGNHPKAIVSFQQAIAINPNFSLYYENLAKAYKQAGSSTTASQALTQTIKQNEGDAQSWYLLAMVRKEQGDKAGARQAFEKYLKLAPNSELADAARLNLDEVAQ